MNFIKEMVLEKSNINLIRDIKTAITFKNNTILKANLKDNERFKQKFAGERCFIVGNGPSINCVDLKSLKDEYTFTVNQFARNTHFKDIHTNFHVWSDTRFFNLDKNRPEDLELIDVMKSVKTEENNPIIFYEYSAYDMIKNFNLDKYLNIHYYHEAGLRLNNIAKWDCDFTKMVPGFSTVIHYIICLAIYMGFKEIVLLGCDCTSFITIAETKLGHAEKALYAYGLSENEKKRMEKVQKQTSIRDELSWQVAMFDNYKLLNHLCEKKEVKLLNATSPTLLDSIERVDLMKYLSR